MFCTQEAVLRTLALRKLYAAFLSAKLICLLLLIMCNTTYPPLDVDTILYLKNTMIWAFKNKVFVFHKCSPKIECVLALYMPNYMSSKTYHVLLERG